MNDTSLINDHKIFGWLPGIVIASVFFVLYVRCLPPSVMPHDTAEMAVVSWGLGLAHSIGYPLYICIGHVFIRLVPFGDPAWRLSFSSACFSCASLILLFRLAYTLIRGHSAVRAAGACAAVMVLGCAPTFRAVSIESQMYPLQILLTLIVVTFVLGWLRHGGSRIYWAAFVLGITCGVHTATIALLPGFVYVVFSDPERRRRSVYWFTALAACAFAGFLAGYVLLFWVLWSRHVPYDFWNKVIVNNASLYSLPENDAFSFWTALGFSLKNGQYANLKLISSPVGMALRFFFVPFRLVAEFAPLGALAAVAGLCKGIAGRRINRFLMLVIVTICVVSAVPFWKNAIYQLPALVVLALYVGVCTACVVGRCARLFRARAWILFSGTLAVLLCLGAVNYSLGSVSHGLFVRAARAISGPMVRRTMLESIAVPRVCLAGDTAARDAARGMVSVFRPGAVVYARWDWLYVLEYACRVEQSITTLDVYELFPAGSQRPEHREMRFAGIESAYAQGKPVYFVGILPGRYEHRVREIAAGLCWELTGAKRVDVVE